ncbi:hypothetical protein [Flavobacterium sp. LB2P53]|uniref:hypothetical protein n=1 Tax=Flavobacterium sp. LB2P53 TaxID=2497481 RepID=UPI000F849F5E|nr:hypothetical protein [Flavobacterium sp. LB2P53]RTY69693.1 hypothetical protein EKL95_05905 [Flavobacterium sp. LB2P53]
MKKITLLLLLFTGFSYSQEKKTFFTTLEPLTLEQSTFFALVNRYYPDFSIPKMVNNIYTETNEVAESYVEYDRSPIDCDDYLIVLQSDNKRLDYQFVYNLGNGNLINKGSFYVLGSDVYKVDFSIKGKNKNFIEMYKNGKEVYNENPYKGLDK